MPLTCSLKSILYLAQPGTCSSPPASILGLLCVFCHSFKGILGNNIILLSRNWGQGWREHWQSPCLAHPQMSWEVAGGGDLVLNHTTDGWLIRRCLSL